MSIEFNHTLVHAKDTWAAARQVGNLLGLAEPSSYGPFAVLQFDNGTTLDYTDWKLGVTWAAGNGWNIGAYYTDTNAKDAGYTLAGRNIGKATGTVFVQKTF